MLPHNNYLSYQTLPNPNQYSFDLKVNVDLNSGKVGLGVPQNVQPIHPFARKSEVPVVYAPNHQPIHHSPPHAYTQPSPAMFSSYPPVAMYPPQQNIRRNQNIYTSTHTPYPEQHSQIRHYSPNPKARSAYDTYPDSSFSLNMERSLDAVNCVICDKPVNREQFHAHLEQHKGRKKEYLKTEGRAKNETVKQSSFAMRNQDTMQNVKDIYKPSARNSLSLDPRDSRMYERRSSKIESGMNSMSRQIEDTHSRIVYAPRDPSKVVSSSSSSNNSQGNFDFNYSKSSGYDHHTSNMPVANQSNRAQHNPIQTNRAQQSYQQQSVSQPSFNVPSEISNIKQPSQPSRSVQSYSRGGGNSQQSMKIPQKSKVSSSKLLPSEVSRKMEQERMRASQLDSSRYSNSNSNWGYQSRKTSNLSRSKHNSRYSSSTSGFYQRNQTKSRVIRPDRQSMLQDCDQSMIHHLKDLSRFSRDSHLGQLNKQLKIQRIEQQSSSDEEYSIKPNPSLRMYASIGAQHHSRKMQQSMSLGLNRTKLPRNYLAMQQFIQNPMYYSCFRSTHRF